MEITFYLIKYVITQPVVKNHNIISLFKNNHQIQLFKNLFS